MNWIQRIFLKSAVNKVMEESHMQKLKAMLEGKKTHINLGLAVVIGGLMAFGVTIPEWVLIILGAVTGITYKVGQNRTETQVKELLETVKSQLREPENKPS